MRLHSLQRDPLGWAIVTLIAVGLGAWTDWRASAGVLPASFGGVLDGVLPLAPLRVVAAIARRAAVLALLLAAGEAGSIVDTRLLLFGFVGGVAVVLVERWEERRGGRERRAVLRAALIPQADGSPSLRSDPNPPRAGVE